MNTQNQNYCLHLLLMFLLLLPSCGDDDDDDSADNDDDNDADDDDDDNDTENDLFKSVIGETSIAVPADGSIHISFAIGGRCDGDVGGCGGALMYITNQSGDWVSEIVSLNEGYFDMTPTGYRNSLVIDDDLVPHIAYFAEDPWHYGLAYAVKSTENWERTKIGDDVGWSVSFALDDEGNAHISHYDWFSKGVIGIAYATNASDAWVDTYLDPTGTIAFGAGSGLAVGDSGIHLVYCYAVTQNSCDLRYMTYSEEAWSEPEVLVERTTPHTETMVLDEDGYVHAVYAKGLQLNYLTNESGSWVSHMLLGYWVDDRMAIAIDDDGLLHTSYFSIGGRTVYYANFQQGQVVPIESEEVEIVDGETVSYYSFERYAPLAIDPDGSVHISYASDNKLMYATNAGGDWTTQELYGQ
jgi:major membrane immunogen (membrane-anchored lipoprotein)